MSPRLIALWSLLCVPNLRAERGVHVGQDVAFVQVRQDMAKVGAELFQRATSRSSSEVQAKLQVQSFKQDPQNIGAALATGVYAVSASMTLFTAEPPQIAAGFIKLGSGLFDAVSLVLSDEAQNTTEFRIFENTWTETAQALPALVQGFERSVEAYKEDGDVSSLMLALCAALDTFGSAVSTALPKELAEEVVKYLGALEDALQGFDDAMEAYSEGSTATAVESVYQGIRLAADGLLPTTVQNKTAYVAVVGALDAVFKDLSATVLEYKQRSLQSGVCWRGFVERERTRPSSCPPKYQWDGEHWCYKMDDGDSLLEIAVQRKQPSGAVPALCQKGSDFHEKRGAWCYKDCPVGSEAAGARCKSSCMGAYPISTPLMCGRSPRTVQSAIAEMATRTLKSGLDAHLIIQEAGVAEGLGGTISSLVDAGKGFVHPMCPILGTV
jgi:hypothetical protein